MTHSHYGPIIVIKFGGKSCKYTVALPHSFPIGIGVSAGGDHRRLLDILRGEDRVVSKITSNDRKIFPTSI
jgi:hypothetical protein